MQNMQSHSGEVPPPPAPPPLLVGERERGGDADQSSQRNGQNKQRNFKFTHEPEENGQITFLDTLTTRRDDGTIKLLVYRKATHTDQYLSFQSHHPLRHKLAVIRTLLERSSSIIMEGEDRRKEEEHIRTALHTCGYTDWAINRVKDQVNSKKATRKDNNNKAQNKSQGMVVAHMSKNTTRFCQT